MSNEDKIKLIKLFQEHVSRITNLQVGNYVLAESLCQRTKMLSLRYFPDRTLYIYDLGKVNFKYPNNGGITDINEWNDSHGRLLGISQSMLDELQLPPASTINEKSTNNSKGTIEQRSKILFASLFLLFASFTLWSFNTWTKWGWLTTHPKRISLCLSIQLAIIFFATLFITSSKEGKFIEWLGIGFSIGFGILSVLG